MFFKIEAKGITPIPQPTKIAISFLKTSLAEHQKDHQYEVMVNFLA
jgi:hypothetical protein